MGAQEYEETMKVIAKRVYDIIDKMVEAFIENEPTIITIQEYILMEQLPDPFIRLSLESYAETHSITREAIAAVLRNEILVEVDMDEIAHINERIAQSEVKEWN